MQWCVAAGDMPAGSDPMKLVTIPNLGMVHKQPSSSSDEAPRVKRKYTKRAHLQAPPPEPEGGMAARRAAP
eukprot:scaffold121823_cov22-Tisochrysis_lutea.AAC.2